MSIIPVAVMKKGTAFLKVLLIPGVTTRAPYPTNIIAGSVPAPNIAMKPILSGSCVNDKVAASATYTMVQGSNPLAIPNNRKLRGPTFRFNNPAMNLSTELYKLPSKGKLVLFFCMK